MSRPGVLFTEIQVFSASEAILFLLQLRELDFFSFRGQRDHNWALGPHGIPAEWEKGVDTGDAQKLKSASDSQRDDVRSENIRKVIREHLTVYRKHCSDFPDFKVKEGNWWADLIFARHQGLNTLLLDWTSNPLVALYFAVENISLRPDQHTPEEIRKMRGAVWAIKVLRKEQASQAQSTKQRWYDFSELVSEFQEGENCPQWIMINPPLNSSRIIRQSGKFTYHPHVVDMDINQEKLQPGEALVKITIGDENSNPTPEIRKQLGIMAVHHGSLFPDCGGVAGYINSQWRDIAKERPSRSLETPPDMNRLMEKLKEIKKHCEC